MRGEPGAGVGRDADEGSLPEGQHAADAREQHETEDRQGVDADIVHQRDAEGTEHGRRERDQHDRAQAYQPELQAAHSSASSSSVVARLSDRHSKTGMSRPNTTTSLKALSQNEAKLSRRPTRTAPRAVTG